MDQAVPETTSARHKPVPALALVGFMGAGKTTVGQMLAARLGWRFLDVDQLIESREGRTIEEIFREDGEAAFRRLECTVVHDVISSSGSTSMVLALGGGAFVQTEIQDCLNKAGITAVFLDAPVAELFRRCEQPGIARPLCQSEQQFHELYEQRRPHYLKAAFRVDTSAKRIEEIVLEIVSGLHLEPGSGAGD